MNSNRLTSMRQTGFTMIEVLVSLLIVVLGLLGLAGLQARLHQAEFESYQRAQALVLLYDMVDRINVHRVTAPCFRITTAANGTPYLGKGSAAIPACTASTAANNAEANSALAEWDSALKGAAEVKGGVSVGAIVDARGCVSYDAASELLDAGGTVMTGTGIYTVTITWLGTVPTVAPTVNCGNLLYPPAPNVADESMRRAVSTTFRLAHLN